MEEVVRPRILTDADVAAYLAGKTVSVVGNAASALQYAHGEEIDSADVVIRMNAGVPGEEHREALGERTDVLSVGNLSVLGDSRRRLAREPEQFWFVKPTKYGDMQWRKLIQLGDTGRWWRYPPEDIMALGRQVGSPASGGLLALRVALLYSAEVTPYGFDWFSSRSWWHSERPEAKISGPFKHNGDMERAWFMKARSARWE